LLDGFVDFVNKTFPILKGLEMMHLLKSIFFPFELTFFLALFTIFISSCTKDVGRVKLDPTEHLYPEQVANILITKCATSGCHNSKSKEAAAGLNLETWNTLFEGGKGGAVVIPYRTDFSTLLYYTNSYNQFGTIQLLPKMPLNGDSLTTSEIKVLFDWIKSGAPNSKGEIKFGNEPERKKLYVANQGCDVVTVFDAKTMLAARYVDVGETRAIEAPHMIRVSPDNKHWYTSFIGGGFFQKHTTTDNTLVGRVNLGFGSWNTFAISSDSKTAYVIDWSSSGKIAVVDLDAMTSTVHLGFVFPHGSALSKNDSVLYVTSQMGNFIYKINFNDFSNPKSVTLNNTTNPNFSSDLDPHEIIFSPDESNYFVTCQASNEVRVMQTSNDSLLAVIPTGKFPQEMSISKTYPYLFVSCMEDNNSNEQELSSVLVINYQTFKVVKSIYAGYQSHGVAVDDEHKRVYVANRNILSTGPSPHHQGVCSGRNGYVTAISLITLEPIKQIKAEVSIDPYGIGITH